MKIDKYLLFFLLIILISCKKDNDYSGVVKDKIIVKIGVILPKSDDVKGYKRTLQLVKDNIIKASEGEIEPEYEWIDELSADVREASTKLASDKDIVSIIGCKTDVNTNILATICKLYKKPMFTFSTSAEIARKFNTEMFMWGLSETDISQSEVLIALAAKSGNKTILLVAPDDSELSRSYKDWFAFQSAEMGLIPLGVLTYKDIKEIQKLKDDFRNYKPDCVIFAPSENEDAAELAKLTRECIINDDIYIDFFFNNWAHSSVVIKALKEQGLANDYKSIKGVTLESDPSSGFSVSYNAFFGENPSFGDAQVYDAVTITCYAKIYQILNNDELLSEIKDKQENEEIHNLLLNRAIYKLLEKSSNVQGGWMNGNISDIFYKIKNKLTPAISGATGALNFTPSVTSTIQYSTYAKWRLVDHKFQNEAFYNRGDGSHSSSAVGSWEWEKVYVQKFDEPQKEIAYPPLNDKWAVIIASSKGWNNYRHQADALAFYNLLKDNGFKDDRIITIMEDDIADNSLNPNKGYISNYPNGPNYYNNFILDYKLSNVTLDNLSQILTGNCDNTSENVLKSNYNDNVIIFWSGHGSDLRPHNLLWSNDVQITGDYMSKLISKMKDNGKFRKFLFIIEACYAGNVAKQCEGIEGLLLLTSANESEQSFGDNFNHQLNTLMSNSFTKSLLNNINANNNLSLKDLYYNTCNETIGSHVTVYNYKNYGNMYTNRIGEYIKNN